MLRLDIKDKVDIPEGVDVSLDLLKIKINGPNGELERRIFYPKLKIKKEGSSIILESSKVSKKEKMFLKTTKAHIKNMILGVTEGFTYELKICSGHFPMTVTHEGNQIIIKNFLGERVSRTADILDGVNIEIKKDIIKLSGCNKELVGQTAANIERSTRITNRDRRRFQDGIYITEKAGIEL